MASSIVGAVPRMKDMKLSRRGLTSIDVFDWAGDASSSSGTDTASKTPGMAWIAQSAVVTRNDMRRARTGVVLGYSLTPECSDNAQIYQKLVSDEHDVVRRHVPFCCPGRP